MFKFAKIAFHAYVLSKAIEHTIHLGKKFVRSIRD